MKKNIITISREFGSGGRTVGRKLAERLNIPFYDGEIIEKYMKKQDFLRILLRSRVNTHQLKVFSHMHL